MVSAPALSDPADLAGVWRLEGPGGACDLELTQGAAPLAADSLAAPMLAVGARPACAGMDAVAGWRPTSLGLALTDSDGRTVAGFERVGPEAYRSIDQAWRLFRA